LPWKDSTIILAGGFGEGQTGFWGYPKLLIKKQPTVKPFWITFSGSGRKLTGGYNCDQRLFYAQIAKVMSVKITRKAP